MAAVEVPQTLEYRSGQLNVAHVLELVKGSQRHDGQPMREKLLTLISVLSLIMSVLLDDQMNSDFQDSLDDEEDTRSSHEYLNNLEEEYQVKPLLAKSKKFFKNGTQRFSSAKVTDQTECHKCGKKVHSQARTKGLIAKSHYWDEEEVSSDDEETEVKALMVFIDEERIFVGKESARNDERTKITIKKVHALLEMEDNDDIKSFLDYFNLHKSSEVEDSTLPNDDTDDVPSNKSQINTTDPSSVVFDSPAPDYDLADESLVCSTPLAPLKKLDGAKPGSRPKTIKSILKSKSTFKAETLKGITLNEPSSAPARGNKSSSAFKTNSAPAGKLKNVNVEDDPPLAMVEVANGTDHPVFRGKTDGCDQITNKDAIMLYSLANGIHIDFANIFWEDTILKLKKKQREKPNQPEEPPFTNHMLAICALDKPVVFKAPKPLQELKVFAKAQSLELKLATKSLQLLLNHPMCPTKMQQKVGPQATGGPTSLGVTSEERANPQLSSDFTTEVDPGLSAPNDSIPQQQGIDKGTKNTSCDHISAAKAIKPQMLIRIHE
nr:hypothetical protein [Tanacetum cinerariifolium]